MTTRPGRAARYLAPQRALHDEGRAVLAGAIEFEGRAPSPRSPKTRAQGRLTDATAGLWAAGRSGAPAEAGLRAQRLTRDVERFREDIAFVEAQIESLLTHSPGHVPSSLPAVATVRAAAFAAHRSTKTPRSPTAAATPATAGPFDLSTDR